MNLRPLCKRKFSGRVACKSAKAVTLAVCFVLLVFVSSAIGTLAGGITAEAANGGVGVLLRTAVLLPLVVFLGLLLRQLVYLLALWLIYLIAYRSFVYSILVVYPPLAGKGTNPLVRAADMALAACAFLVAIVTVEVLRSVWDIFFTHCTVSKGDPR